MITWFDRSIKVSKHPSDYPTGTSSSHKQHPSKALRPHQHSHTLSTIRNSATNLNTIDNLHMSTNILVTDNNTVDLDTASPCKNNRPIKALTASPQKYRSASQNVDYTTTTGYNGAIVRG